MSESSAPAPRKRRRFGCVPIILTLLTLFILGLAVAYWLARSAPEEWTRANERLEAIPQEERQRRADALENMFASSPDRSQITHETNVDDEVNRVVERTITVPVEDANIWLATKLPQWLENQNESMPEGLDQPRVWIDDGELVLSFRADVEGISGVVSTNLKAELLDNGNLGLEITGVRTGKLPIPAGAIIDQVRRHAGDEAAEGVMDQLAAAFDGTELEPVWDETGNEETRQVRLIGFDVREEEVELKLRHGPKEAE